MKLSIENFATAIAKQLLPVYFISGDEPLQLGECADHIRLTAKNAGYLNREVLTVDKDFDWNSLRQNAAALSIFADKKLIDLRMPGGKPGAEGSKVLAEYCGQLPGDAILLISAGKIGRDAQKAKWFKALDAVGGILQVWPLQGRDLVDWLKRRAQMKGLMIEQQGLRLLASRVEGNMLAAAQEIEKLFVLHGEGQLSAADVESFVADSARYDVYKLVDSLLMAKHNRAVRILQGLKGEGLSELVVVWAIAKQVRLLRSIQFELNRGQPIGQVLKQKRVFSNQQGMIEQAIRRLKLTVLDQALCLCGRVDRQAKGQMKGDSWETLFELVLLLCGQNVINWVEKA